MRSTSHTAVVLGGTTALVVVGAIVGSSDTRQGYTSGSSALVAPAVGPDYAGAVVFGRFNVLLRPTSLHGTVPTTLSAPS